jgi:hypothetical protein
MVHSLEVLVLSHNHLTGSILDCIKDVSYLFYLDVSSNSLMGGNSNNIDGYANAKVRDSPSESHILASTSPVHIWV